ncbi:MAG TPA: hypothetical protein DC000_10415 [Clostridiales bacterium]|nr:hypothetical protein [Clostridiales bacterium]
MKKQQIYSILLVLIIVLMLPLFNQLLSNSNTPFRSLKAEDIKSIDLYLQPPNKGVAIDDEKNIQDNEDALNKLVVKAEESSKVDGQVVTYTLNKNNGDSVEVKIYSPYVIIDEKIYKADYEICDVLNLLGNDLLENNK